MSAVFILLKLIFSQISEWKSLDVRLFDFHLEVGSIEELMAYFLFFSLWSINQAEQTGNTLSLNVPQVQLINPDNQIVQVGYETLLRHCGFMVNVYYSNVIHLHAIESLYICCDVAHACIKLKILNWFCCNLDEILPFLSFMYIKGC